MKKTIFLITMALLLLSIAIIAGCSKSSTSTTNNNPPTEPTSLTASQTSRHAVHLTWGAAGADSFLIQRSDSATRPLGNPFKVTGSTSYDDSGFTANHLMYYWVAGENINGTSDYSAASLFTFPAVYSFTTDQTGHFIKAYYGQVAATWDWDGTQGAGGTLGAGKLTITSGSDTSTVGVYTSYQMNNSGWFESQVKVLQWYGRGDTANVAGFFMEANPQNTTTDVVGVLFYPDSTLLGYYTTSNPGHITRVATNPTLDTLTANVWHHVAFFHSGAHWKYYLDDMTAPKWEGDIPNIAIGMPLNEEWQFSPGRGTYPQTYYVDDWANNDVSPAILAGPNSGSEMEHGASLSVASHKK